jgi:two-component system response regulator GlrR
MDRMTQVDSQGAPAAPEAVPTLTSDPVGRRREDRIVGASEATRQLIAQATAAARSELPVVVWGPPGSDRELVARAIHAWGPRKDAPLEMLSCAAIPEALQSRELFGCAEGVYPAVPGEYVGALERAAGTTLVLEDIDELRSDVAGNLWSACRERRFQREGESVPRPLTARLVCTASRDPELELGDLPHHTILLRPLSDRPEDVLPLAAHYLRVFSEEMGLNPIGFTSDARSCLLAESWDGDVQELRQRIRQAVRLAGEGALSAEALLLARDADDVPSFKEAKRAFETRYVTGLLRRCDGNISRAARLAKKDRKDFYDVIRRTGIDPSQFRS